MPKWLDKLRRKKTFDVPMKEPASISPNPMVKEGQLALVIALPLLAFLIGIIYVAKNFYITQEEFALFMGCGFLGWICMLIAVYALSIVSANKHMLFDREFGFTDRLHPRLEVYCKPEDVRLLVDPKKTLDKPDELTARLKQFGLEQYADQFTEGDTFSKYLYYFRQKHGFEGWDKDTHEIVPFQSHYLFTDKPFNEQFVFGAGQENWWGPILFNHTHAESDNVQVLGWGVDPFTNEPLPICVLKYSSIQYRPKADAQKDLATIDGMKMIVAHQHGLIDRMKAQVGQLSVLKDKKFEKMDDFFKMADEITDVDTKYYDRLHKPRKTGLLRGLGKWIAGIVFAICIVLVVWIACYYLFGVWMPLLS